MAGAPVMALPRSSDQIGAQVAAPQPAAAKATRCPSAVPTNTTPPPTAGWVTMRSPASPTHSGVHLAAPQPVAVRALRWPSSLGTYSWEASSAGGCVIGAPIAAVQRTAPRLLSPAPATA